MHLALAVEIGLEVLQCQKGMENLIDRDLILNPTILEINPLISDAANP